MAIEDFRQHVYYALRNDKELVVDPAIFDELLRWDKVGRVDTALKVEDYDNELSRFRYDVTLALGKKEKIAVPEQHLNWAQADEWRQEIEISCSNSPGRASCCMA